MKKTRETQRKVCVLLLLATMVAVVRMRDATHVGRIERFKGFCVMGLQDFFVCGRSKRSIIGKFEMSDGGSWRTPK